MTLAVRPARAAVLVPRVKGIGWMRLFEAALASQCQVWGGHANIVLPLTADMTDRRLFWELVDRFDADEFVLHSVAEGDMAELQPRWWRERPRNTQAELDAKFSREAQGDFLERMADEQLMRIGPTPAQWELITRRVAPLHGDGEHLRATAGMWATPYPLMDVLDLADLPRTVHYPKPPQSVVQRLLLTAQFGRASLNMQARLPDLDVEVVEDDLHGQTAIPRALYDRQRAPGTTPWDLSMLGLGLYSGPLHEQQPAVLVVGDTAWDFALFYALHRWTGAAWWVPTPLLKNAAHMTYLSSAMESGAQRQGRELVLTSASSDAARDRAAEFLRTSPVRRMPAPSTADWLDVLPDEPLRVYEKDAYGHPEPTWLINERTPELDTPVPTTVTAAEPTSMKWMTEVRLDTWAPLRHRALGPVVLDAPSYGHRLVRTTREGVAYFSPHWGFTTGQALESIVVRPRLRAMPLLQQLQVILEPYGWRCESSNKGVFAVETIALFGGVEPTRDALRDPVLRPVLNAYLDYKAPGLDLTHDSRRYLSLKDIVSVVGGARETGEAALHDLLGTGVLRQGLVLKCSRCRQAAWYDTGDVGSRFICNRCRLDQAQSPASWLDEAEPVWSYALAEVVFQFLEHDGDLPLLAAQDLLSRTRNPSEQALEVDVYEPGAKRPHEVDIALADGFRLWVGEASKKAKFDPHPRRLRRLKAFAEKVDAYGVTLATSRTRFPAGIEADALALFDGDWPRLDIRVGVKVAAP
jgi:hypothetical protein